MKIRSASEAHSFILSVINSHQDRWEKIKNTEAYLIHGEKPFSDEELIDDGQSWVPNHNYGKGRAEVEQGVVNNQTDLYRSFAFVDVEFEVYSSKKHKGIKAFLLDDYIRTVLGRVLSLSFVNAIEEDERMHPWVSQIEYYSFTFGFCPILRHDWSYLGDPVPLDSIGFRDRTKIGEIRDFSIFDVIKIEEIYEEYKINKDRDTESITYDGETYNIYPNGWIKEGMLEIFKIKIALLNLDENYEEIKINDKSPKRLIVETWDHVDEFISRKGLSYLSYASGNIYIAKIFCWQNNNTFEEVHVVVTSEDGITDIAGSMQYLLYMKERRRKRPTEIITLVKEFGISQDSYISSLRGAGKFIAEEALRYDTKRNSIEAKLLLNGSTYFSASNSLSAKSAKIKVSHGFAIVDDDLQIIPNQIRHDVSSHIQSLSMEDAEYEKRVKHISPKLSLSSRPTKDEVQARNEEFGAAKNSRVPIKLADYSRLFTECFFDLVEKDFDGDENELVQNTFFDYVNFYLLKYGIEMTRSEIKQIVSCVKKIKLNPALGDPNAIREAMEVVGNSENRKHLNVMYLLAIGFSRKNAVEYVEVEDYGDQIDKAAMENNMFYTTSEVSVGRHQDALSHLNTHFAKADRVLKGVVGGEDPVKGFNWITNCLINTAKHIEYIQSNPFYKKQYKQFLKVQQHFEGKARALAQEVEKMKQEEAARAEQQVEGQQQQQQQQGISPQLRQKLQEDEIKMMEKIRRTNMLTEEAMNKKREMFELQKELSKKSTESNIEMQREFAEVKKELALLQESVKLAKR
jgi:energy-coupling factor transporter ATP-binding protein EcfA2